MLQIRRAVPADLDRLVELHRAFCEADAHVFAEADARTAFTPLLKDDEVGVVWLAEGESRRGYAVVTWGWSIESAGRDALLDEIYAEPPGEGIGTALLEAILADLKARGTVARIFLETEEDNAAARRMYQRHGFNVEPSVWMSRGL